MEQSQQQEQVHLLRLRTKLTNCFFMVSLNKESLKLWQEQDMEPLRYAYDLLPGDTVLDIGSYQREWGNEIHSRYGSHVEYFDALDNRAAWTHDGTLEFGGAYYYTTQFSEIRQYRYKCVDIAPFLESEVRLVKINIEGGEYELLKYIIDFDLMKNIVDLQVQFHLIEGRDSEKEYLEIAKLLTKTHVLSWRYPFVWESWLRKQEHEKMFSC